MKEFGYLAVVTANYSDGATLELERYECEGVKESTLLHETGRSKQSVYLWSLFHIIISIPLICRFWYRRTLIKSMG